MARLGRQEFAPHLLIGRHGLDRRVVLVGAYEVGAVGAGRAQHRVDVLPDAKGLLFALGQAGVRARSDSTSGAMPFLKSCAMTPVANTQRPALMPCANLTLPARARREAAALHVCWSFQFSPQWSATSHCSQGKRGRILTPACVRAQPLHRATQQNSAGATDESCAAMVELDWDMSCRERHGLGPSGELSEPHHHRGGAVPGGRPDRRADAPRRFPATGQDWSAGCHRKPHRRFRHDRRSLCRARHAGRLHAACQFSRRCAEHPLHAAALPSGG